MKYLIRSVKYFFYFAFLTTAIVFVLIFIGAVNGDINDIFEGGYNALWKMGLFFAVVAAAYPKLGFVIRDVAVDRDWSEVTGIAKDYFKNRRYQLESENTDTLTFIRRSTAERLSRMYEDRITLSKTDTGFRMEGLRKDVLLAASGLEHTLNRD
ncbi:MAG: hypothetical protein J6Q12_00730 [Bacteroidales bacterium]|nr:hypothetical protein [Bacteroidales bacterium]